MMKPVLWLIFASAVVVTAIFTPKYLIAQRPGKSKTSLKYKMICSSMFVIAGFSAAAIAENTSAYAVFMLIGLLLSWAGDFLLHVKDTKQFFMFGLLAFLTAHILYLLAYQNAAKHIFGGKFLGPVQIILVPLLFLVSVVYCYIKKINVKSLMLLPVAIYILVLSTMFVKASGLGVLHIRAGGALWEGAVLIVGSFFFFCSDATLGILMINKKTKSFPMKCFNIITYFSGQLMLASSILFFQTQAIT
ncbi:MAG: lysoplasmalogenase [Oscillospiraceae bacterium]|jgi:uncharacterized membrane protein YhhN|nr:lysoplasmalogenase [Oscillospiraceae bacterium]